MRMPAIITQPPITATDGSEHITGFPPIELEILDDYGRWQPGTDSFDIAMSVGEINSAPRPQTIYSLFPSNEE